MLSRKFSAVEAILSTEQEAVRRAARERMRRLRAARRAEAQARGQYPPLRKPLPKCRPQPRPSWWTRERVIRGLRAYYRDTGQVITSAKVWHELHRGSGSEARRPYPSAYAVLKHFASFREAWAAAGVETDRGWEVWTELEEWYLREAAGFVPIKEIARDLRRSCNAVRRRLYDLGMEARCRPDYWSLARIERVAGGAVGYAVQKHLTRGRLPSLRGTQCVYVDPADLPAISEVNWVTVPDELHQAIRRRLQARIVWLLDEKGRCQTEG